MPIDKKKICVLIPAYNVATTIGGIVREIKKQAIETVVINDGSQDATYLVAEESQAIVLNNAANKGKGASLRQGFRYALNNGYDIVITMDGDGQHAPGDIGNFLNTVHSDADIVLGNRMNSPKNMPLIRWITNKVMSKIISYLCHQNIPDSQNGFRLIKSSCLRNLKLKSDRFEIESEILLEAARNGCKIISVPICSIYENTKSQINPFMDTIKFIRFILSYVRF